MTLVTRLHQIAKFIERVTVHLFSAPRPGHIHSLPCWHFLGLDPLVYTEAEYWLIPNSYETTAPILHIIANFEK
jgi:hypothetical protein